MDNTHLGGSLCRSRISRCLLTRVITARLIILLPGNCESFVNLDRLGGCCPLCRILIKSCQEECLAVYEFQGLRHCAI